jgi:hypothetical protein
LLRDAPALALLFGAYTALVAMFLLGGRSFDLAHRLYRVFFSLNIAAGAGITLALIWRQRPVIPWPVAGALMVALTVLTAAALLWATRGEGRGAKGEGSGARGTEYGA